MESQSGNNIDPNSYTPLYIQIANNLKKAIDNGEFKQGEKLPSDSDLVQQYNISRITATAALDELVKAHLAYRERGRGTFVAQPILTNFSFFSSFTSDMVSRGLTPSSKFISLEITKPDLEMIQKTHIPETTDFYCLKRLRLADDAPVAFQAAYLPKVLYPGLETVVFKSDTSLYKTIQMRYQLKPTYGEAIVEAGSATADEAKLLEIKFGVPVLIIWHITLDDHFNILEYVHSVYRSDRFSFSAGRSPMSY